MRCHLLFADLHHFQEDAAFNDLRVQVLAAVLHQALDHLHPIAIAAVVRYVILRAGGEQAYRESEPLNARVLVLKALLQSFANIPRLAAVREASRGLIASRCSAQIKEYPSSGPP